MSEAKDPSGAALNAAPLSWDAFCHHRQAFLDRRQIAEMEEQLELAAREDDIEDDLDDFGLTSDDDQRGGWTLLGY